MKSVTEYLRSHLLMELGCFDRPNLFLPDLQELRATQWNSQFEMLMRNRLVMGAFRYGTFEEQNSRRYNNAGAIRSHLEAYQKTGNAEHLVDIANLALVEFTRPFHHLFHFASIDDGVHVETAKCES